METKLCLLVLLGLFCHAYGCDMNKAAPCQAEFMSALGLPPGGSADATAVLQIHDPEVLDKVCDAYAQFMKCAGTSLDGCHKVVDAMLEGFDNLFNSICSDSGKEEFLEHAECLSTPSLDHQQRVCVAGINSGGDLCGNVRNALDCVGEVTEETCGEEAAEYTIDLMEEALDPLMEVVRCPFGDD